MAGIEPSVAGSCAPSDSGMYVTSLSFPSITNEEKKAEELWQTSVTHPLDAAEHDIR